MRDRKLSVLLTEGRMIRCSRVISSSKSSNFFCLLCFVRMSPGSVGELNFSQDFMNERRGIGSVRESLFKLKVSFAFIKLSLTELVVKRRNASRLIKPFFVLNGWQDRVHSEKFQ